MREEQPDFLVSYTARDRPWAEWIAWILEDTGYRVLLQAWDMVPGSNWLFMMDAATRESTRTIAVLSDAYLESNYGRGEAFAAYRLDPQGNDRRLVPIRVENCALTGIFAAIVTIDLFGLDSADEAATRLINGLAASASGRDKPTRRPSWPGRVRSVYLEQVRQVAPQALVGREAELAELARFCTAPEAGPFTWWRGGAWTGKSALMSWFVLHPPAGVRIVSFFVTARFAGNSDRVAFTGAVTEQLTELTGQTTAPFLTDADQATVLRRALDLAAETCADRGERLVLVVDGLDEDRGSAGSIAALLPARPSPNLRIIVAGRATPELPEDVPSGHPLHDSDVVRVLEKSPEAGVVRRDMWHELDRLTSGTEFEQEILGLVAAAGGGLTGADLAALVADEVTSDDVDRALRSVVGRSFTARPGRWHPITAYVLGHEELQQEVTRVLADRMAGLRDRLHAWAEGYRRRGWPADTPEYLLRGYYRLLHATGDLTRLVGCATDQRRHDRMLDITGGDTGALAEITEAQNAVLAAVDPDLTALARLAAHRVRLTERNANIPATLPALWACLGQPTRGEALARALSIRPDRRVAALASLAVAVANGGDRPRAAELVRLAGQTDVTEAADRAHLLVQLCTALLQAGEFDEAMRIARDTSDVEAASTAFGVMSQLALVAGDVDRAERLARAIEQPYRLGLCLARISEHLAVAGDRRRARQLVREVADVAEGMSNRRDRMRVRIGLAQALARLGSLRRAEWMVGRLGDIDHVTWGWLGLSQHALESGDHSRALALARRAHDNLLYVPMVQLNDLIERMAEIAVGAGDLEWAAKLATSSYQDGPPPVRWRLNLGIALAAARSGDKDRVREAAGNITMPGARAQVLGLLAMALVGAGDRAGAGRLARRVADPTQRATVLSLLSAALCGAGDRPAAERAAREITVPAVRASAFAELSLAALDAGDRDAARSFALEAERIARTVVDEEAQTSRREVLRDAAIQAGDLDLAERICRELDEPGRRVWALRSVGIAAGRNGDAERARRLALELPELAGRVADFDERTRATLGAGMALAETGDAPTARRLLETVAENLSPWAWMLFSSSVAAGGHGEEALRIARGLADPDHRGKALVLVSEALRFHGERARAEEIRTEAEEVALAAQASLDTLMANLYWTAIDAVAESAATTGDVERARRILTTAAAQPRPGGGDPELFGWHGMSLRRVKLALLVSDDLIKIEQSMPLIPDDAAFFAAMVALTAAVARTGDYERARRVTERIPAPEHRDRALAALSDVAARAGHHDRAEQTARAIATPAARNQALVEVSIALGRAGERDRGRRLLGEVLTVADWSEHGLAGLVEFAPTALTALADDGLLDPRTAVVDAR